MERTKRKSSKVVVWCYSKPEIISRKEAIEKYSWYAKNSDGAERERYTNILLMLHNGANTCYDTLESIANTNDIDINELNKLK